MKKCEIQKPIGLARLCRAVETVCENANIYKCGIKPMHLIVPLDSGSGRTAFIGYLTDMYKQNGVLDFSGSLDDCIEVTADGSSVQSVVQTFSAFAEGADYKNEYCNIAGIAVGNLAKYTAAPQFSDFIKEIKKLFGSAYVVFFVSGTPTAAEEKVISKLIDAVGKNKIYRTAAEEYTAEDICRITEKIICEHGVLVEHEEEFYAALSSMTANYGICKVKDAVSAAEELIRYADFSGFTPVVNKKSVAALTEFWAEKNERSEIK